MRRNCRIIIQRHKFVGLSQQFNPFLRPPTNDTSFSITMNPTIEYVSPPHDTAADSGRRLDSILSAALSPEFASLEPKSSRPTNDRAHRVNQSSSSHSSANHRHHWQSSTFHMAIHRLRAQQASQSQEFLRMAEIARTRNCNDDETVTQGAYDRPTATATGDAELLQSSHAASNPKSPTASSSDKHHTASNKRGNEGSSHIAAGIGGSSRRQNQKRKGHAARCA